MATIQTESLNYWRSYFATAKNSSVFDILDHAITVAASDFPEEFSRQKSRLLERLSSIRGLGGDQPSELGFGGASKTGCDQASTEQKVEPLKPTLKIRIKLVQRPKDDKLNKPCLDKATLSKPCLDEAKLIKPPCVDEDKLIKPKPKPNPCLDEVAIEAKLQATKRKLHNQYQEIDNIKRQRRIQVLKDLPKQDFKLGCPTSTKPQGKKLGNHNLHSTERRRVSNKLGFQGLQCSRVVSATH
ncbi:hypothetical protein M0R45_034575 [Rubus argutus]|uniref:Uncharacterized protein n=1 Tax=Rubus argutus TaxID=59490 RepID=A0AAW1VSW7_RUBAR